MEQEQGSLLCCHLLYFEAEGDSPNHLCLTRQKDMTSWCCWKGIIDHFQILDVIQYEQPIRVDFQPALNGINCIPLILFTSTRKIQQVCEACEIRGERLK